MDLIDICERAKEAGIDVEIRIDTDTGHHQMEPFVVIEGRTHATDSSSRSRYAVRYSVDMLKEAKVAAEDLIKMATDEIIENLCPKEITEEMWEFAINNLYSWITLYAGCRHKSNRWELDNRLHPLRRRVESGERTRALYDEINAIGW